MSNNALKEINQQAIAAEARKLLQLLERCEVADLAAWNEATDTAIKDLGAVISIYEELSNPGGFRRFTQKMFEGRDTDDCLRQMSQKLGPKQTVIRFKSTPFQREGHESWVRCYVLIDNRELMS